MLEVLSALTGESIAVFEDEELANAPVKALKKRLAQKLCIPRFRLRILQGNWNLDDNQTLIDDQTLTHTVVQLVILEFLPPDRDGATALYIAAEGMIAACAENNDKLLEQHLNQPRNPNVENEQQTETPLCAAAFAGSLDCISTLIAVWCKNHQWKLLHQTPGSHHCRYAIQTSGAATALYIAAQNGHLEVVRFLVESGANKDQGTTDDGATALYIAAQTGHLEVVRFLVESGATKTKAPQIMEQHHCL